MEDEIRKQKEKLKKHKSGKPILNTVGYIREIVPYKGYKGNREFEANLVI